jgi:hypothetical protein
MWTFFFYLEQISRSILSNSVQRRNLATYYYYYYYYYYWLINYSDKFAV